MPTGIIEKGNIIQAKKRCIHCASLTEKDKVWWCDEADLPVEDVVDCREWTVCSGCQNEGADYCPECLAPTYPEEV